MPDFLSKVVSVNSLAKPIPSSLLAARKAIQLSPDIQEVFRQAKAEGWDREALADALFIRLPEYMEDCENLWDTSLYLADEFLQVGDSILLISTETGQALYKVTEDDIYLPQSVPREDNRLVQPLPRLCPEVESFIIQRQFDLGRDQKILQIIDKRLHSSELLKQEGDNRLLVVTRDGRKQITERLQPDSFLPPESGLSKEFCDLLKFGQALNDVESTFGRAFGRVIMPVPDPLALNLRYDPYTALKRQITAQWVQCFAHSLATLKRVAIEIATTDDLPEGFWLADPDVALALRGRRVLPVRGMPFSNAILLHPKDKYAANVYIASSSYECKSREFLDKWEVVAKCEFALYVYPETISFYQFKDIEQLGLAEVI